MKHYIIVKWNEKVTDKSLYYKRACDAFNYVTKIAGVTALKIYQSNSDRANRADLMIEIECTKEGLANYDVSDLHKEWKKNFSEYIGEKTIFDHE